MKDGHFLYNFFSNAGVLGEPNTQGEYSVPCPFEHDKGYEQNPSAHVNLDKGVFHCKTCLAEGRFGNGGLSEVGFIAQLFNVPYNEAIVMKHQLTGDDTSPEDWVSFQDNLKANQDLMNMLRQRRGLTDHTIDKYRLGYSGDGVRYPVFIFGELCDIRTYDPDAKPKMRSQKGATTLIFPFDDWNQDDRPTLLVGGENDALIGRQLGFNAVTFTGGEGAVPSNILLKFFKERKVYVCYDIDLAGKKGGQRVAFKLKEAGAEVYRVDLTSFGLSGEKDDKDLSDAVLKHGLSYADLDRLMQISPIFSEDEYLEEKNRYYPLIDLWESSEGKYHGRRMSTRAVVMGKYDRDMHVPSAVKFTCTGANDPDHDSEKCPLHKKEKLWTLNEHNLKDMMYLVEVKESQMNGELRRMNYIPKDNTCVKMEILAYESVQKVMLTPDVESENELGGFKSVEQYAYNIGKPMNDGDRYRIYFKPYSHPNEGQRVYLIIDRYEESDNALNTFVMNESIKEKLAVFQGDPKEAMNKRFEMAKGIIKGFTLDMMVWGTDLVYHSPLSFKFLGKEMKGYPEVAIIGESRTGKSDTAEQLQDYYRLGNRTSLKNASVAGLLGGADKMANGSFKVRWGVIPRNNKGMMILDEISGAPVDVWAQLTDMRSSGEARLTKITGGKAPARTRLLWIGNPRVINGRTKSLLEYPSGVDAVLDLIGADEDVARFDAVMLVVDRGVYYRPDEFSAGSHPFPRDTYVDLIRWIWTRKSEQVVFEESVEDYIWKRSLVLNEAYATDVKLLGAESSKKLARFAVACAACCFSCDETGERLVVKKEHVDWAEYFLNRCYDDDVFRLKEYVQERRRYNTLNPEVEAIVHKLMNNNSSSVMIRELIRAMEPIPRFNLEAVSGMDKDQFNKAINYLTRNYLIYNQAKGIQATKRLIMAARTFEDVRLKPLSER
ncbi:DNA primase [compost metagenome]